MGCPDTCKHGHWQTCGPYPGCKNGPTTWHATHTQEASCLEAVVADGILREVLSGRDIHAGVSLLGVPLKPAKRGTLEKRGAMRVACVCVCVCAGVRMCVFFLRGSLLGGVFQGKLKFERPHSRGSISPPQKKRKKKSSLHGVAHGESLWGSKSPKTTEKMGRENWVLANLFFSPAGIFAWENSLGNSVGDWSRGPEPS